MIVKNEARPAVIFRYAVLSILAILFLIPFYVILRNAFMSDRQIIARTWTLWAKPMQLGENLRNMFFKSNIPILLGLRNSALVAVIQTAMHLTFSAMAGFALARIPFKYKTAVFTFIVATMMIPIYVTFIPTYIMVMKLGLINTLFGILLPGVFNTFSAFMYRQFFLDFPIELEEAGTMDGLSYPGIFLRITMPNAIGISVALGVITFFRSWNAFLWPMVIGQSPKAWTIQVVLSQFLTEQNLQLNQVFLGALVALLPVMIFFFILQKFIVQGVTMSGVKG